MEVAIASIEKFTNDFDTAMKKENKKAWLRTIFIGCPILIGTLLYLFTNITFIFIIGVGITGVGTLGVLTIDLIKDMKSLTTMATNNSKVIKINEEQSVVEVLAQEPTAVFAKDFYKEDFKEFLEERKKHKEEESPSLHVIDNNESFLDKKETIEEIARVIKILYSAYKIPPLKITDLEWDIFFDTTYYYFFEKGMEEKYYDLINLVVKMTLATALINNRKKIDIRDFIENLIYLENDRFRKNDIANLQNNIRAQLPTPKIIDFASQQLKP